MLGCLGGHRQVPDSARRWPGSRLRPSPHRRGRSSSTGTHPRRLEQHALRRATTWPAATAFAQVHGRGDHRESGVAGAGGAVLAAVVVRHAPRRRARRSFTGDQRDQRLRPRQALNGEGRRRRASAVQLPARRASRWPKAYVDVPATAAPAGVPRARSPPTCRATLRISAGGRKGTGRPRMEVLGGGRAPPSPPPWTSTVPGWSWPIRRGATYPPNTLRVHQPWNQVPAEGGKLGRATRS